MFQEVLFGKFDEAELEESNPELLEDILTSDVFGAFKYLPSRYLETWLRRLVGRSHGPDVLAARPPETPRVDLWPRFPSPRAGETSREPDVLIEWGSLHVVVEAKLRSGLNRPQLEAERDAVLASLATDGPGHLVLVVATTLRKPRWASECRDATKGWLAFNTWHELACVFSDCCTADAPEHEGALVQDLLARLRLRGIIPFVPLARISERVRQLRPDVVQRIGCGCVPRFGPLPSWPRSAKLREIWKPSLVAGPVAGPGIAPRERAPSARVRDLLPCLSFHPAMPLSRWRIDAVPRHAVAALLPRWGRRGVAPRFAGWDSVIPAPKGPLPFRFEVGATALERERRGNENGR